MSYFRAATFYPHSYPHLLMLDIYYFHAEAHVSAVWVLNDALLLTCWPGEMFMTVFAQHLTIGKYWTKTSDALQTNVKRDLSDEF